MVSPRKTIWTLLIALAGGLALALFIPDQEAVRNSAEVLKTETDNNPIMPKIRRIGQELGLDLEFMKTLHFEGQFDAKFHPIWCEPPRSFDILVFGDSVSNWGIVPEILEQRTGKRVGTFSSESILLNAFSLDLLKQVASEYLKPGGTSIFLFTDWTQLKDPNEVSYIFKDFPRFRKAGFVEFMKETAHCENVAPDAQHTQTASQLFTVDDLKAHQERTSFLKGWLSEKWGLRLPRIDFYDLWVEPRTNPALSKKKHEGNERHLLRWNRWSVLEYVTTGVKQTRKNVQPPEYKDFPANVAQNAEALLQYPGKKVYVIPYTNGDYPIQRSIYKRFYEDRIPLADLASLHPENAAYPMEAIHVANEGMIYMSNELGLWLKSNLH